MDNRKKELKKGINMMAVTLLLLILSPIAINIGFKALQKGGTYVFLVIGMSLAIATILLFALGIRQLLKYLFDD